MVTIGLTLLFLIAIVASLAFDFSWSSVRRQFLTLWSCESGQLNIRLRQLAIAEWEKRNPFRAFVRRLRGEEDGSIVVRLTRIFPGFGVPVQNDSVYLRTGISLSTTGQQTNTIPATGTLSPGTTVGRLRIKIYNGGGTSPTLIDLLVQASDGTNTIPVYSNHPNVAFAISTTSWFDRYFEYLLDTATVTANAGGANGQLLPGGVTSFNILTTLGGTTPTASMDLELAPLV